MKVLVVEDSDSKWDSVATIISTVLAEAELHRARDLFEGEREIAKPGWELLVLDISLDIRAGGGRAGAAHDHTGGLKILGKMYYEELEIPTIIITGFDSFPSTRTNGDGIMLGLEHVDEEAAKQLGNQLVGLVRHLSDGWEQQLEQLLVKFRNSVA